MFFNREIAGDLARAQIEEKGGGLCKLDEGRRACYFKSKNKEWTPVKRILARLMTIAITVGALPPAVAASSSAADGSAVVLPEDVPSPWAIEEVTQAIVLGMVPSNLQSRWRHSVTRIEFAQMVVHFLAFQYGYDDDGSFLGVYCSSALDRDGMPFGNSSSWWNQFCGQLETFCDLAKPEDRGYGNAAYALGIVNGRGAGTFDPNGLITRQEAAAMLMRCYRRYGGAYDAADPSAALTDWNSVADWAQADVAAVLELGVMNGTSETTFGALGTYTREQAVVTLLRLYANGPVSRSNRNLPAM